MMRHKTTLVTSIALLFLTAIPVRAAAPMPTPTPPKDQVKYTNIGAVGKLSNEIEQKEVGIFERIRQGQLIQIFEREAKWNYNMEKNPDFLVSKLETLKKMLSKAQNPLTPITVQKKIIPTREEKYFVSGKGTVCLWKREHGKPLELVKKENIGKYYSNIIPELSKYLQLTYQLGPMLGDTRSYSIDENDKYNFDKFPPLEIATGEIDCSNTQPGTTMEPIKSIIVGDTGFLGFIGQVIAYWLEILDREIVRSSEQLAHKQNTPYYEMIGRMTHNQGELPVDYLEDKERGKIEKAARGYVNTFIPKTAREKLLKNYTLGKDPHGEQENFNIKVNPRYALYTHDASAYTTETAAQANECMIYPLTKQKELTKNWVCPPSPTPSALGDVCSVAKAYNIPCCQLKGVMELETGSGTNMGSESCSTSHGNFRCCRGSACGPAQILCGQYDAFAGKDKLDMCDPVGAAELLARAMLLKLCQADGKCDSYDWTRWGEFVKKNYKVSDGDYSATAYFYELANGCAATACSQYRWGPGKGYCDAVESYCKTGQVLPDNTSPEFCAACNEEIIRAGQTPIQCTQ